MFLDTLQDRIDLWLKREKPVGVSFTIEMRGQPGEDIQPTPFMSEDLRNIRTQDVMSISELLQDDLIGIPTGLQRQVRDDRLRSRQRQQQCDFVVRAAQDRCVDLLVEQADAPVPARSHHPRRAGQAAEAKPQHLFEVVQGWEAQGQQELHLEASKQAKARVARVVISCGGLRLLPPQNQQASELRPLVVWVVRVWEPEPPEGVEGLEWVLLTSVPTVSVEQAWQRVDWYRACWLVEDYHQGLKTGCSIELRQLQSYEALRRLLGLLAPAAVRLLQLRAVARDAPERLASEILPLDLGQVVALLAKVPVPAAELTAQQCWYT